MRAKECPPGYNGGFCADYKVCANCTIKNCRARDLIPVEKQPWEQCDSWTPMSVACPKCGAIAEWNAYYGRFTCTRCPYEWK